MFDPWQPLVWRYGAMSAMAAVALVYLGHPWGLHYAIAGYLAPAGYLFGKAIKAKCWTCYGEAGMGLLVYGGLPLASLF